LDELARASLERVEGWHQFFALPCLLRYFQALFLKTDWAGTGMGWILMQPDDSDASAAELALFRSDGICNFDVTMNGARLRPIRFGSRGCTSVSATIIPSSEKPVAVVGPSVRTGNFSGVLNSFGSATAAPLRKSSNMMDLSIRFVDFFQVFYRPAHMMRDVDGLTRHYDIPIDEPRHLSVIPHIMMRDVDGLICHYDTPLITHHLMVTLPFYLSDRAADLLLMTLSVVYLSASPPCRQNPVKCLSCPTVSIPFVARCSCLLYLSDHAANLLLTTLALLSIFVLVISSQLVSKLPAMQSWVLSLNLLIVGAVCMKLSKLQIVDLMSSVLTVTLLLQLSSIPLKFSPCFHQLFYLVHLSDFQYLNHLHAPLPHPLCSPLNIQMCSNMWFSSSLCTDHPPLFKFTDIPDPDSSPSAPPPFPPFVASIPADAAIPVFPTTTRLFLSL
jgi:hypothetical protein